MLTIVAVNVVRETPVAKAFIDRVQCITSPHREGLSADGPSTCLTGRIECYRKDVIATTEFS